MIWSGSVISANLIMVHSAIAANVLRTSKGFLPCSDDRLAYPAAPVKGKVANDKLFGVFAGYYSSLNEGFDAKRKIQSTEK